jgi:hypothetical protein
LEKADQATTEPAFTIQDEATYSDPDSISSPSAMTPDFVGELLSSPPGIYDISQLPIGVHKYI